MDSFIKRRFTRSILPHSVTCFIFVVLLALMPGFADAQQGDDPSSQILWRDYSFDPTVGIPQFTEALTLGPAETLQAQYYFVQFVGPITKAMKAQVAEAGAKLLNYVPNNAYLAKMDPSARARVEGLTAVRWVGVYEPAMRLSRRLKEKVAFPEQPSLETPERQPSLERRSFPAAVQSTRITLTIIVFQGSDMEPIKAAVRDAGGEILFEREGSRRSKLQVVIPRAKTPDIARVDGVMWIEELLPYRLQNDVSRGVIGVTPVWTAHGLQGNGQIIAVADTGLDSGVNDASMHDDFEGRITNIFSWPVQNIDYCDVGVCFPANVGADDTASDLDSGHGTHTAGSTTGNGTLSGGVYSGVAPQASLVFQALEQYVDLSAAGFEGYMLGGIPSDLNDLYQQAYDAGARIHSNSWNRSDAGAYSDNSFETDEFVWDHPDILIVRSAGNDGEDTNNDSVVETGSVGSPGTAKNALTLGASENNRPAIPLTYSADYGPVIDADPIANNSAGMAAFSSRGPANADTAALADDRIKPDLAAPGTMVVSTRTQAAPNTVWFTDDMEGGLNGWTAGGTWAQITADSHTATHSWHDSPGGDYADNSNMSLTSPTIDLSGSTSLLSKVIRFWSHYDLGTGDRLRLDISKDGGASWIGLDFTGQQAGWNFLTIGMADLPDYYNSANFRIRFTLISDGDGDTGDGFYIDDLHVLEGAFFAARLSDHGLAAAGSADDQNYLLMDGTSMSTPLTAGAAALVRQYYTQELGLSYVSAALLRATLINGATDMSPGQYGLGATREIQERPNNVEGWGRVNLDNSLYPPAPAVLDHVDELAGLETGETRDFQLNITDAGAPVIVTMVYHDYPGASIINNLDMTVITPDPGGTTEYPNGLATTDAQNNVEQIVIPAPVVGTYTIRIHGQNVPQGPQPFAVVTSAGGTLVAPRDPVDVALALDLSGSMLSPACPTCDTKLDVLKDAVELFVAVWTALTVPDDRISLNHFRTTIDEFDIGGAYLVPVLPNASALVADVQAQTTVSTNLTAMGGSLQTAIGRLADDTRPRNIILFTDGMQNVNPMVLDTDPSAAGVSLVIDDEPGRTSSGVGPTVPPTALDTALDIKINTIGVGATPAFTDLLEDIAVETTGVSKLTLAPDEDLRRFYVEQLVDALRRFSPQLLSYRRSALAGSDGTEAFTVNRGARKVLLKLSWKRGGKVSFRTEKDGIDLSRYGQVINGDYYRIHVFDVPFTVHGNEIAAEGDWNMRISGSTDAPYEAAMIVDEPSFDYSFSIPGAIHLAGDPLELVVQLEADGNPIIDAERVQATILKPQAGLGNLLSETSIVPQPKATTAETAVASGYESTDATAGQKKFLALQSDPEFFERMQLVSETVDLVHDGAGRYSGQLADTARPGIYTVVFTVEGEHPGLGRYQRTETRSTRVRFGQADFDASVVTFRYLADPVGEWNAALSLRPRDRNGNYLGPDYGPMISVAIAAPGELSGQWRDLGDGTYEMSVRIPSGSDPVVTIDVMDRRLYEGSASQLMAEEPPVWLWWLLLILAVLLVLAIILWLIRRPASP